MKHVAKMFKQVNTICRPLTIHNKLKPITSYILLSYLCPFSLPQQKKRVKISTS